MRRQHSTPIIEPMARTLQNLMFLRPNLEISKFDPNLQKSISAIRNQRFIGQVLNVLVEGQSKRDANKLFGKTDSFKTVVFPKKPGIETNMIIPVHVNSSTPFTLFGDFVSPNKDETVT